MTSKIALGTCAWSCEDWRGGFYPDTVVPTQWLGWYARFFNAVEADSTFFHAPTRHALEHWLEATPAKFTFTVKLPRALTHERRLRDCDGPLESFLEALAPLRPRLGCILIQLPATFRAAHEEDILRRFVARLPRDWPFAIEFRDPAWHAPRTVHWLREHNVCWVWADSEPLSHEAEGAFEVLPQTADFLYVRLLGDARTRYHADGSPRHVYEKLLWPRGRSLENWAVKIRHHMEESRRVLVFANNHFEGCAPLTCQRLARTLGMELALPHLDAPDAPKGSQMDLL